MTKELGEAIEYFKRISKEWKKLGNTQIEAAKKLELILQVLKNSIPKEVIENKKLLLEGTILNNDYASNKDKDIAEYQVNILQELLNLEE